MARPTSKPRRGAPENKTDREINEFVEASKAAARSYLRHLHPATPPAGGDVRRLGRLLRKFARVYAATLIGEITLGIAEEEINDVEEEGIQ